MVIVKWEFGHCAWNCKSKSHYVLNVIPLSVNDAFELLEDGQCLLKLTSIEIFPLWLLATL